MGGNLIAGWAHSRDLPYVSTLMRQYNTPAKIRQTLELGEQNGITAINSWVMDDNAQIFRALEKRRQNEVVFPGAAGRGRRLFAG